MKRLIITIALEVDLVAMKELGPENRGAIEGLSDGFRQRGEILKQHLKDNPMLGRCVRATVRSTEI